MDTISVVISAYNEEKKLPDVLHSVKWVDEIIVVDNQSTDKTAEIARSFGAKVYSRDNNPMLNVNKNFGFQQTTKDWILNLDGDEIVTESLRDEIQNILKIKQDIDGYWIPRKNIIFGKWIRHGLWWPDKQLRLFRRGKGKFPCEHIHEYLVVNGKTSELSEPLLHYNYETISQFLRKLDTIYTENEVENIQKKKVSLSWQDAIRMPASDFIKVYFAQQGYKDGLHGFVLAMLQAIYAFIVFAKLWEKKGFSSQSIHVLDVSSEFDRVYKEIRFWVMNEQMKTTHHPLKKFFLKLRKKFFV
ncbi:MAG: glycosyltransferase family 2 protein [Patescibacteria group bacterium]|nr:glycosyltransferase family 2 protein [Patescibacteria group bacterium]